MTVMRRYAVLATVLSFTLAMAACQTIPKGLTPAQIAVLKEQHFKPTDEGWELGLSDKLLFDTDVAQLNDVSRTSVSRMASALVGVGIVAARVDGHTDGSGTDVYNDQLSLRRAQAVADALIDNGMRRDRIGVRGMGKRMPIADNRTPAGRSENRRVAVIVANE